MVRGNWIRMGQTPALMSRSGSTLTNLVVTVSSLPIWNHISSPLDHSFHPYEYIADSYGVDFVCTRESSKLALGRGYVLKLFIFIKQKYMYKKACGWCLLSECDSSFDSLSKVSWKKSYLSDDGSGDVF